MVLSRVCEVIQGQRQERGGEGGYFYPAGLPSKHRSFILAAPTADWLSASRRFNDRGVEPSRGEPKAKRRIVIETDRHSLTVRESWAERRRSEVKEGGKNEKKNPKRIQGLASIFEQACVCFSRAARLNGCQKTFNQELVHDCRETCWEMC